MVPAVEGLRVRLVPICIALSLEIACDGVVRWIGLSSIAAKGVTDGGERRKREVADKVDGFLPLGRVFGSVRVLQAGGEHVADDF